MTVTTKTPWIKTASRNKGRGIQSRSINSSLIQYAEKDITSAQVLTLNATPIVVVPAPGAGYVTEFISAVLIIDYNTATYATNGNCNFKYTNGSGTTVSDTVAAAAFLHQADDCITLCQALSAEVELTANAAIVFSVDTGEVDTGDSPIRIKVAYRVHATGL
jgi:hypothetical protein